MKKIIQYSLVFLLFVLAVPLIPEEIPQNKISGEDREKLKRISAQFQLLTLQAQILNEERAQVYARNCAASKLAPAECSIDPETGIISGLLKMSPPATK